MNLESMGIDPQHVALAQAVHDIETNVAQLGWDRPSTIYALVPSRTLLDDPAGLPDELRQQLTAQVSSLPHHLTAVLQDSVPGQSAEESLASMCWPDAVAGMAIALERVSVPPAAEKDAPSDPDAALSYFSTHPDREEIRIVAGALRTGQTWCAIRSRRLDEDSKVAEASDLVPELTDALLHTFQEDTPAN